MQNAETDQPIDKRCRSTHPESIVVGSTTFERNDITAKRYGITERTLNEEDKKGAPYRKFGNIKYRPQPTYDEFIASDIRSNKPKQQPKRRRVR